MLQRFWFEFDISIDDPHPIGVLLGCGVTAYDYVDAVQLVANLVFKASALPPIRRVIEGVDITTLDANHVLSNMGVPSNRGIWFPLGYS